MYYLYNTKQNSDEKLGKSIQLKFSQNRKSADLSQDPKQESLEWCKQIRFFSNFMTSPLCFHQRYLYYNLKVKCERQAVESWNQWNCSSTGNKVLCFMDIFLKEASFLDSILCSWGTFRHYRCWTEIDPLLMNTREWVLERNLEISNIACYLD